MDIRVTDPSTAQEFPSVIIGSLLSVIDWSYTMVDGTGRVNHAWM